MPDFESRLAEALGEVGLTHFAICGVERVEEYLTRDLALSFVPRSVAFAALPYGGAAGRVARYARGKDYHLVLPELLDRAAEQVKTALPALRYQSYADISPYREREAAERAGLGVQLKNHLLYVEGCGTYCLIGELVCSLEVASTPPKRPSSPCVGCGGCRRACPTGAIEGDFSRCLSALTQTRRELSPEEELLIRKCGTVWGCDICQQVCPLNQDREGEGDPDLSPLAALSDRQFRRRYADRAYSYRGIKPLLRNIALLEEEKG